VSVPQPAGSLTGSENSFALLNEILNISTYHGNPSAAFLKIFPLKRPRGGGGGPAAIIPLPHPTPTHRHLKSCRDAAVDKVAGIHGSHPLVRTVKIAFQAPSSLP
jgi:hypothetical protein